MPKRDVEREQIEWVFGLTGGELGDEPWQGQKYWYEGVPEYVGEDFADEHALDVRYRTIVLCALYDAPPETIEDEEGTYEQKKVYSSSGEAECPCRHDEDNAGLVVKSQVDENGVCPLCDEAEGNKHGYIYLGEGWAEAVYKLELKEED